MDDVGRRQRWFTADCFSHQLRALGGAHACTSDKVVSTAE